MNDNKTTHYYSKAYYFYRQNFLHNGNFTFNAGTYTWPFEFVMPTYADPGVVVSANGRGDTFRLDPPFRGTNAEELHILPATLWAAGGTIEYYVEANIRRLPSASIFSNDLRARAAIDFQPLRLKPIREAPFHFLTQRSDVCTLKLLPDDNERKHSFRSKIKGVFNSSCLPQLSLVITVSMPQTLEASSNTTIPCLVSVSRGKEVSNGNNGRSENQPLSQPLLLPSTVQLRHFELQLHSHICTRTRTQQQSQWRKFGLGNGSGCAIPIQKPSSSNEKAGKFYQEENATVDLGKKFGIRLPSHEPLQPEFSTYNIFRHYTINLKLRLECAGETIKCDLEDIPLELLPDAVNRTLHQPQGPYATSKNVYNAQDQGQPCGNYGDILREQGDQQPPPSYDSVSKAH